MRTTSFFIGLALIVLLGAAVRLPGVWWGFHGDTPHFYHPDENRINRQVVNIIQTGKSKDYYPDGFASMLSGLLRHRDPLPETWRDTVFAARLLSVAHSTGAIVMVAWIAWLLGYGFIGALVAASGFAFAGVVVAHAHFGVADSALVFWLTLTMALALALRRWPWLAVVASAITGGFAVCVKMAWPALLPTILAAFRCKRPWLMAPLALLLAFLTFRFFDPEYTWANFLELREMVRVENVLAVKNHTYHWNPFVLLVLLVMGVGLPFAVFALRGAWHFWKLPKKHWFTIDRAIVWAPTLGYVANFLMVSVLFPRHVLPMIPAVALAMAAGWSAWMSGRKPRVVYTVIIALTLYQAAYLFTIERAYWLDTREVMDEWLQELLPEEARVHAPLYVQLHRWQHVPFFTEDLSTTTHMLLHEADYWRYRRSAIHPFNRNPAIKNTYRPHRFGRLYWSIIRNRTTFEEVHRVPWRAITPELMLHKRVWGAYPEFVGDTIFYERTD